jgi:hypothetical protein
MDLNKEAEEYLKKIDNESGTTWTEDDSDIVKAFVNFVEESKYVQAKILQAQIDVLNNHIEHPTKPGYKRYDVLNSIKKLEQQLKQLTDE